MSSAAVSTFQTQLPWDSDAQQSKRFSQITLTALALTLLFAAVVMWQEVPAPAPIERESLPPQLARIVQAKLPPPPPVLPEPEPEVLEKPKPEAEKKTPPPEPVPDVKPVVAKPQPVQAPEPDPQETLRQAKETAKQSGLLAFADDLASMRKDLNLNNAADTQAIKGTGKAEQTQRKRLGAQVNSTSGAVTAAASTNIGARGQLEGRKTTEFNAPEQGVASLAAKRIEEQSPVVGDRDLESIRKVLDANKGAVYALYRRALRQDPSLSGKVTVHLVIEPNGTLSGIKLISSELDAPELEQKLLARIGLFQFGAEQVLQTELEYSFNFLPY